MPVLAPTSARRPRRRAAFARRRTSWFAALCLVLGWLHVWQHRAEHDDDDHGHFESEAGENVCQLADTPWTDVPAAPCAPDYAADSRRAAPTPAAATGASPADRPPIRAPPRA